MKAFPKDVTVKTMTTRHIGVESELGIRGGSRYNDIRHIEKECRKRGLLQSVGYDGGGREFRTNPIAVHTLKQVRGHRYLTEYYEELRKSTTVLTAGGTHIHISILNTDHKNMESNATAMAIAFYKQFQKIAGRESSWAYRLNKSTISEVRTYLADRRRGGRTYGAKGSMLTPTHHQTLEFRGGKGSNNCKEILAWIEFIDNVVKISNRESIEGVQFKRLLRTKRIAEYVDSLKGWRKLTKKELEQKFKGSKLC
jgi:hypothetical protein